MEMLVSRFLLRSPSTDSNTQVCGCVKFIPTKPKELVSGGYDQKLLHFDYTNGNLLSEREIGMTEDSVELMSDTY